MIGTIRVKPSAAIAAAAMAFLSACASEQATAPTEVAPPAVSAAVLPGNSFVIISDLSGGFRGTFAEFVADVSGRATTEFWDNQSADFTSVEACNIGHYAAGLMSSTCANDDGAAANSDAGSVPGIFTEYLADGPRTSKRDATSFMFNGNSQYTVTVKGSYGADFSEVGYFTKRHGVYTFFKVDEWGAAQVGNTRTINTNGDDWGFYIKNDFNPTPDGCGVKTHCSDADGGFSGTADGQEAPFQQFALFANRANNRFLVGAEDNKLELIAPGQMALDSDYNDYVFEVVPTRACDFVISAFFAKSGRRIASIAGNAGGNAPSGGILGDFRIDIGSDSYFLPTIESYGPVLSGPLAGLPNARLITGTATNGTKVEIRVQDSGWPGRNTDWVYVKLGTSVEPFGAAGTKIELGNTLFKPSCRTSH